MALRDVSAYPLLLSMGDDELDYIEHLLTRKAKG